MKLERKNEARENCIDLLLNLGAEDLTHIEHPNKEGKKYLRLKRKGSSYIDFNFDYAPHEKVSVTANRRLKKRGYMAFDEIKPMLTEMGIC